MHHTQREHWTSNVVSNGGQAEVRTMWDVGVGVLQLDHHGGRRRRGVGYLQGSSRGLQYKRAKKCSYKSLRGKEGNGAHTIICPGVARYKRRNGVGGGVPGARRRRSPGP
jgi:hypothetical protein